MIETEDAMTVREELHQLVDHLPESEISTTRKLLRALVDPVDLSDPDGRERRRTGVRCRARGGARGTGRAVQRRNFAKVPVFGWTGMDFFVDRTVRDCHSYAVAARGGN